jgi:itaconate CoA-transferase
VRFQNNSKRVQNRDALEEIINGIFKRLTRAVIIERLENAQIAYARLNSVQEFVDHPQLAARNRWREIDSPAGPLRALVPPITMDGVEPVMGAVPALGQHTQAILEELGFDAATIASWKKTGVI